VGVTNSKGILIFNKNESERQCLRAFMKTPDTMVFDTSDALEAFHILRTENIAVILAGSDSAGRRQEFKDLVENLRAGVHTIFTSPFSIQDKEFSVTIEECLKLINDYVKSESSSHRELTELKKFALAFADRLLQIFAVNDTYFFNNGHYVSQLAKRISQKMDLEENLVDAIQMAALLRDLGRLVIHQHILDESKRLTQVELTPIRSHPVYTMQILRQVRFPWNLDSIISQHHEHYDGRGYPLGLKGREISIGARIIGVADAYFAMTTDRPYRKALQKEKAILEIKKNVGTQFDPEIVEKFLEIIREEPERASQKESVLVFELEPNVAMMLKLSPAADEMDVLHVGNHLEAFSRLSTKNPQYVIVDIDPLDPETFIKFYDIAQQMPDAANRIFLVIIPDISYLKFFDGTVENNVDYLIKPLNVDQLLSKIRGIPLEAEQPVSGHDNRGLTGRIEQFSLTDIIHILSLGLKTARIDVKHDETRGTLYLLHGQLLHASVRNLRGPDAFLELMKWEKGIFCIIHGQVTNEVNITSDTMGLLIEAASFIGEQEIG
jgi:HD-GYP domain-containing protein (c-di-GMP phosphodiesterase class II)/DNA-binding response OmpR family regulator